MLAVSNSSNSSNLSNSNKSNDPSDGLDIRLGASVPPVQPSRVPSPQDAFPAAVPAEEAADETACVPPQELFLPGEPPAPSPAEELMKSMADDAVRAQYTFINLCALVITFFAVALTLLLIRQGERYSVDNIQLTAGTFLDGSYTESLSKRYIGELRLDSFIEKTGSAAAKLFGFSQSRKPQESPSPLPSGDDEPQSQTSVQDPSLTSADLSAMTHSVSVDPDFTGSEATMPAVTVPVASDFTGVIKHTCKTLTTSFTTTGVYSPSATAPPSLSSSSSQLSETDPSGTEPSVTTETSPASGSSESASQPPEQSDEPLTGETTASPVQSSEGIEGE